MSAASPEALGARTRLFTFEPLVPEHEGVGIGNGIEDPLS
ncbi:hypothetical protein FOCG_09355 [Fusarium oxysporum f. sp. radicis-lycopersici 26381]|jgi:hypothetical protein|uniref:Uncharacterized protein n=4 Tax=Fusarium oxysporum TaxID=5507 RepID=W9I6Z2_FUSOX|nr:hypothetical protein FOXG_18526 [Fusarium oxysporum f. sp. lycopersici 4287]EWY88689.1 hypothetical protein FOYG_09780 [Fusarium oxysporum NRRL 32931]EWZ39795.1 hypothetical protein FOZG_08765 [Fusarium oxysporum Fo47]EWZ88106.1 hypothetical protein FOWG_09694 [Fusarium oxysporum f. sp. lycopersici MN25]EXK30821.1 hypothetical protein FOMG_12701 [Fusarium oxysporum f. sp. melonis 26406]EXL51345.1 hypothetical protein FOCG_09355 [Fusarium oxysporum f. sp. radicis-lycopersici 26381]